MIYWLRVEVVFCSAKPTDAGFLVVVAYLVSVLCRTRALQEKALSCLKTARKKKKPQRARKVHIITDRGAFSAARETTAPQTQENHRGQERMIYAVDIITLNSPLRTCRKQLRSAPSTSHFSLFRLFHRTSPLPLALLPHIGSWHVQTCDSRLCEAARERKKKRKKENLRGRN